MKDDHVGQGPAPESEHELASITIELTPSQVDRVVRGAAGAGNMAVLVSGQTGIQETLARDPKLLDDPRMSRSLMVGLRVLASLPSDGSYIGVVDLAQMLDKSPSTTHRYLATLQAFGLVDQHAKTRKYRLAR